MADYARLDEELDALSAGLDVDAILAAIPKSEGLEATDAALGALGEDVSPPKRRSFMPPKMSDEEAQAMADDAAAKEAAAKDAAAKDAEEAAPDALDVASALSNFHAGLTPSDLQELAEVEAAEAARGLGSAFEPSAPSIPPLSPPPADALITPTDLADESIESGSIESDEVAAASIPPEVPSVAPPIAPTSSTPPIFKAEDLAAIRASSPPPPGADAEDVVVDLEELEELEIDELDFVEFDDDELELELGEGGAQISGDNTEQVDLDVIPDPVVPDPTPDAGGEGNEEEAEKKGFFKKIFG